MSEHAERTSTPASLLARTLTGAFGPCGLHRLYMLGGLTRSCMASAPPCHHTHSFTQPIVSWLSCEPGCRMLGSCMRCQGIADASFTQDVAPQVLQQRTLACGGPPAVLAAVQGGWWLQTLAALPPPALPACPAGSAGLTAGKPQPPSWHVCTAIWVQSAWQTGGCCPGSRSRTCSPRAYHSRGAGSTSPSVQHGQPRSNCLSCGRHAGLTWQTCLRTLSLGS